jgi:hypothetical protein
MSAHMYKTPATTMTEVQNHRYMKILFHRLIKDVQDI